MSKTFSVQKMAIIALMTAVLCILAPISIPVFISPVPISLGVLAIYLTAYVLSPLDATISVIIFILLGTFGLPVFSGYSGGLSKLVGPTGGYIIGFLFTVYISSLFIHMKKGIIFDVIGMITGLALCYILGTIWFSYQQGKGFIASLLLCVVPFLIGDAIKIIVAVILGTQINKRLAHLDL
ncbi:biotin transporter BioY [Lachnoanaerobaculum orale]|uniref:biotin transporter BioY n=1 Tax=Lachnoanaerobaculum orale TaxID=979627 RepID=UPI0023A8FEA3|nr:biotin transporter BioY [Lachnoanaerobaculum orale]